MLWLTEEIPGISKSPVSELSDNAVLELADVKMNQAQNQRLGDLQAKGKTAGLTDAKRYELSLKQQATVRLGTIDSRRCKSPLLLIVTQEILT
jgi:hypothetical protein